jgi:hypothetical protein
MKRKWLLLGLLLCGTVLLAPGCTTRSGGDSSETPPSLLVPTAPRTQQPTPAQGGGGVPDLAQKPEMTVLGTLESGIPFGVTEDGHSFKGDPAAPVLMIEFSEYQ